MNDFLAARLCMHRVGEMSDAQRVEISDWLMRCAASLILHGERYSSRYVARCSFPDESVKQGNFREASDGLDAAERSET